MKGIVLVLVFISLVSFQTPSHSVVCGPLDVAELCCDTYCNVVPKRGRDVAERVYQSCAQALECRNARSGFGSCGC